jgi:enoyl-CoA hydratase
VGELVLLERHGPVAQLTLARPDALNALSRALLEALDARLAALEDDAELRFLVVTGEGRAFAAGADVAEMRAMSPLEAQALSRLGHRVLARLASLPVATVAAVDGFALGGGCELALACDWIWATRRSRFGQPEVGLGLVPGFGGTTRLLRRVGGAWARQLVLLGEPIGADEALRIGLANQLFDDREALLAAAQAAGAAAARKAPLAVAQAKRLLDESQDADLRVAHALEQSAFGLVFASEDRAEGVEAFLAKRAPRFRGR